MTGLDTAIGRLIAAVEADGHTGHIGTRQFRTCRVCQALRAVIDAPSTGAYLPYRYADGITATTLDAATYPYGNNQPGTGVQLTMQTGGQVLAVRMPGPSARLFALSVIGSLTLNEQPNRRRPTPAPFGSAKTFDSDGYPVHVALVAAYPTEAEARDELTCGLGDTPTYRGTWQLPELYGTSVVHVFTDNAPARLEAAGWTRPGGNTATIMITEDRDLTSQGVTIVYRIAKSFHFEAAHQLHNLPEGHQCSRVHGHSYVIEVWLRSTRLDLAGFVTDFANLAPIGRYLDEFADHRTLNDLLHQPTSELLAHHLFDWATDNLGLPENVSVEKVRVSETGRSWAEYAPDGVTA